MTDSPTAETLFSRHRYGIHRYLSRATGSTDAADDLLQEVFVRIVRGLNASVEIVHERGWVFSVAHSVVNDHLRQRQRAVPSVSIARSTRQASEPSEQGTQLLAVALEQSLQTVPEADRAVFLLKEVAGLTYEEIAQSTGCTVDSVRARLHRTRAALREMLVIRF